MSFQTSRLLPVHCFRSFAVNFRRFLSADAPTNAQEEDVVSKKEYDILKEQLNELTGEKDSLFDKYRRSLAEMENLRRRSQRQIDEVADTLEMALKSCDDNKVSEEVRNIIKGVEMTKDILMKTFAKHGLTPIEAFGEKFDPDVHEAVFEIPQEHAKHEPGYVGEVLKSGYKLHNRTVRPAKVGVVKSS